MTITTLVPFDSSDMPCAPSSLRIMPYALPGTLGRAEREEAAARILIESAEAKMWVGVSWSHMVDRMEAEFEAYTSDARLRCEAQSKDIDEEVRTARAKIIYVALSILTLGVYALFAHWPKAKIHEAPRASFPFSMIYFAGPQAIANGICELIERGLIRKEEVTTDYRSESIEVLFPTPALLKAIGITPPTAA